MTKGVLVPAFLAAGVISVRAVLGQRRAPYPYEFLSWLVVYGGIGMIPGDDGRFSETLAWGYLLAIVLAPSFADVLGMLNKAHQTAPAGTRTGGAAASRSAASSTRPAQGG